VSGDGGFVTAAAPLLEARASGPAKTYRSPRAQFFGLPGRWRDIIGFVPERHQRQPAAARRRRRMWGRRFVDSPAGSTYYSAQRAEESADS